MPANRFYTVDELQIGRHAVIRGAEHHHLAHVMRVAEGEEIELVNGRGALAKACLVRSGRQEAETMVHQIFFEPPVKNRVIIAQAMPKLNRLEFILEKCTELGMDELWLFRGEKSEKREVSDNQLQRMESITIAAMKQSGRLYLPHLFVKDHFTKWQGKLAENCYFGDVLPDAPSFLSVLKNKRQGDVLFFIGPEAGFSASEETALKKFDVKGVKLHRNILRTDTASIVALSMIGASDE